MHRTVLGRLSRCLALWVCVRGPCLSCGLDTVFVFVLDDLLSPFAIARLKESLSYADQWLELAPSRLLAACKREGVTPVAPLRGGNRSVACWGQDRTGAHVAVKLAAYPGATRREAASLKALASSGRVPGVILADLHREVLVSELVRGSTPLSSTEETREEVAGVAGLLAAFAECAPDDVPEDVSLGWRVGQAWQLAQHWTSAPRIELATAADRLERASVSSIVVLHGDLVPGNILLKQDGELLGIDPQAVVGEIEAAAASWGLLRSNGDEQGWRAGGGAVRRALLLCSVLGADSERTLAHLSFQALELACRQAYWGEWDWVSESLDVSRAAAAALR